MNTDELDLAYMSIETLKNRITYLEEEIRKLIDESNKPHPASSGWSGDDTDSGYHNGFNGNGY